MKTESKELPAVLAQNVQESGLELNKAQAIALNYAPLMIEAQAEAEKLKGLTVENPEDVATAKRVRIDLGKICSQARKVKDENKELIKIEDRYIMGLFNAVEGFARLTQKDAEVIEKHAEKLAAEARVKLKAERCEILKGFDVDGSLINIEHMTPEVWATYLNGVKLNYQTVKEAEEKAKAEAEAKEKAEAEAREVERKEAEKRAKEIEETARKAAAEIAKLKEDREKAEKVANEKAKEDAKRAKELQAKIDLEREKREKLEKIEKDRKLAEDLKKKAEEKAAKKAAKAPAIEKAKASLNALDIDVLELSDVEVAEKWAEICEKFDSFKAWAIDKLNAE